MHSQNDTTNEGTGLRDKTWLNFPTLKTKTKIDNIYLVSESDGCKYLLNVFTGRVTNYITHDKRHLHIFPSTAVQTELKIMSPLIRTSD